MIDSFLLVLAAAAPVVHVGDPAMSGRGIVAYDNVWLVTLHPNEGGVIERGLSTDHVRFMTIAGRRYLSRIETEADVISTAGQPPVSAISSTFNIFDPVTMAPRHGEARSSDGDSMQRDFHGRTIVNRARESGGAPEKTTPVTTAEPVFDAHGGMTGLLLTALPLKIGYRASIPGIGDNGMDYTEIRVVARETISAGHLGKRAAWKVEIGGTPAHSVYWISKQAPYVIKAVVNGAKGYASWDMVD